MTIQQTCIKCFTQFTGYISICNVCQASEAQIKQQKKNLEAQRELQQEQNRANEQQIRDRMNWEHWQRVDREREQTQQNTAFTPSKTYRTIPYVYVPPTAEQLSEQKREEVKKEIIAALGLTSVWAVGMVVFNFLPFLFFGVNWWTYLTALVIVPLTIYLQARS